MPKNKYTLRLKELRRISAVDNPAQPTAAIRLIKRADADCAAALVDFNADFTVAKLDDELRLVFGYAFTSTKGGQPYHDLQGDHVISDDDMIKAALEFVTTGARADVMHDRLDHGGSVPFVMPLTPEIAKAFGIEGGEVGLMVGMRPDEETYAKFKDGTYKAFSIDGIGIREQIAEKSEPVEIKITQPSTEPKPAQKAEPKENENMPEVADLQKQIDELNAKLSKSIAYGALSDAEKAYRANLPDGERDAWMSKSRAERASDVAKAAEADAEVYKDLDGNVYRQSDDPRIVASAKRADEAAKETAVAKAQAEQVSLEKRAEKELGNFKGSVKAKAELLRAIKSVQDDEVRKEIEESLAGADGSLARMYESVGTWSRESPEDPLVKFESLVEKRMTETGEQRGIAYNKVLDTPEGIRLMTEYRSASN